MRSGITHIVNAGAKIYCNECQSRLNTPFHDCRICHIPLCRACMDRDCHECDRLYRTTGLLKFAKRHYIMRPEPDQVLRWVFQDSKWDSVNGFCVETAKRQFYMYKIDGFDMPFREYIDGRVCQGVVSK